MAKKRVISLEWYGDKFMDIVEKTTPDALFSGGEVVLEAARGRAPRRTGELSKSGFVSTQERDNYVKGRRDRKSIRKVLADSKQEFRVTVGFAAWYSNLFEDTGRKASVAPRGNRRKRKLLKIPGIGVRARSRIPRMAARPFLGPAVDETKEAFAQTVAGKYRGELESKMGGA